MRLTTSLACVLVCGMLGAVASADGPWKLVNPKEALPAGNLLIGTPTASLVSANKAVQLTWQNLSNVRVNYYLMDVELLFSRNPFVQQYGGQFATIKPNATREVALPAGQARLAIRAGTTQSVISRIENDRVSPSVETLRGLLHLLGEDLVLSVSGRDAGIDRDMTR